jgi:putative ABC transport system permease protein
MSLWSRVANVFRAGRVQRDLDEELRFHMDERIRELTAAGLTPEAAAREVARRFGSPLRLREASLDVKLLPWLDSMVRDVRLGARMLRKNGVVTAAAVVSLSLAFGASVAAFALVDALVLRPLPVLHPDRLIYLTVPTGNPERPEGDTFSDPLFLRLRDAARGHADLFAMSTQVLRPAKFDGPAGEKEQLRTQFVSGDAFDRLGVVPAAGRLIARQDDLQPGAHPVAVASHAFWMRRFGGDPAIVGRWFTLADSRFALEDRPFQIVGVAERGFTGVEPGRPSDLWLPYAMYNPRAFGNFYFGWFRILGRLNDNVRVEAAQAVVQAAFTNLRRERARADGAGPERSPEAVARFIITPLYLRSAANGPSPLRGQFERPLWILAAIAALVVLIAGSNVASLFLARTAAREHEMALRLSIGAGRGRLIQQMLVESALVAGAACALGLLFAAVAAPAVVGMLAPAGDPVHLDLRVDWRMVAFAGGLTVLTTALFGAGPALRASSVAPMTALRTGGRSGVRASVMRPFVALQVAFGLVVLFVGSLLVLSFARLSSVNPGFAASDVLLLSIEAVRRVEPAARRAALLQVLDRLRNIPGVQAASAADYNVLGRAWTYGFSVPGAQDDKFDATMAPVTPGFFETMSIPVLGGRGFVSRDIEAQHSTAIVVNDAFARRYFGREPAVGRTLEGRFAMDNDSAADYEVVGVVADTRHDLRKPAAPTIYILLPLDRSGTLHVRVAGDATALASRLREEIRAASPLFRATSVTSQAAAVGDTLLRERLLALLSGFFAVVGLVLAAVGLYGVLSYSVVQRTREIGIRVALGARQLIVVRTVVLDAGLTAVVGAALGLAGGLYLARFVEGLLFEVRPLDFWSLALPLGTLVLTGLLAAALPALRATRVDPVIALRYE